MRSARKTASRTSWVISSDGPAEALPDLLEPALHLGARERVERAEGLVEQQHLALLHDRAQQRRALAHAARELERVGALEAVEAERREQRAHALARLARGSPRTSSPSVALSSTRRHGSSASRLRHVGEAAVAARRAAAPSTSTSPALGRVPPVRIENAVDLPQPLGPRMATNSPARASSERSRSTSSSPKRLPSPRSSSFGGRSLTLAGRPREASRYHGIAIRSTT